MLKEIPNSKISSLIIGIGGIGYEYDLDKKGILTHFKSLKKNNKFLVKGVVDTNKKKIKSFKAKNKNILTFYDYDLAIKKLKPDLVIISTSTKFHYPIIKKIIKYKFIKYLIVEKPCGKNFDEFKKIYSLCKKNNKFLFINFFRLFNQKYLKLFNDIKKSKSFFSLVYYNRGYRNNCSHIIGLLSLFLKFPKKINLIKNGSKIDKINPSFEMIYSKGKVLFIGRPLENNSLLKMEIFTDKGKWTSNNSMNNFLYSKKVTDKEIKGYFNYTDKIKDLKFKTQNIQKIFLDKVFQLINEKKRNYMSQNYLNTLYLLDIIDKKIYKEKNE